MDKEQEKPKKKEKSQLRELIETVLSSVVIAAFLITFVVQAFYIPSGSMIPTLMPGDRVLVNKFIYRFTEPKRGDIMVFRFPLDPKRHFIKRVIAVGNETVELKKGRLYVNGKLVEQPYLPELYDNDFGPYTVPAEEFFCLGDNRNNSEDSRYWGCVPRKNVIGKAFVRYWPLNHLGLLK